MRFAESRSLLLSSFVLIPLASAAVAKRDVLVQRALPGQWQYVGCYTEAANGRTLGAAAYADNVNMTTESCINFCAGKGYPYAGTEYYQECYCDSQINPAAAVAPATDCSFPCKGNASEVCGAGGRLSVYHTAEDIGPKPNPGVNGWAYAGCWSEGTTGRTLTHPAGIPSNTLTVALCTTACKNAGYTLAGVEYGGECYCDNSVQNGGALVAASSCNMVCNGNSSEFCGAGGHLDLYNYGGQVQLPTGTSSTVAPTGTATGTATGTSSTATATGPSQPPIVGDWNFYGCRTEATGQRALSAKTFAADTMTLEACATFCAGYTFFGIEYARECYCGNTFNAGSVAAASSDCNMVCSGNSFEYCGAGNRLSAYAINGTSIPTGTSTSTSSAPTSTVPVPTGMPAGWTYQGCWVDGLQGRILKEQLPDSQTNSQESCAQACFAAGYKISGTEYGVQCFCGNELYNGAAKAPETDCSTNCPGNATEKCGAGNRISMFANGPPQVFQPPAPQTGGLNGSWTYQGCVLDNINNQRTFFWQLFFHGTMTPNMCLSRCAEYGYMAAGLEYGEECYCGDPANIAAQGASFVPDSQCDVVCAGNASAYCGGGGKLSTYFWTGDPLYSWEFASTPQTAGQYQPLGINGVTIPLMTSESITGKVSFLSKWGTGPAGETGAYELDLSLMAFRTLHIKTDVFCAAGITLPDKAGRQLTVGGWSGDSTFGMRLYWPDGQPGTWGTHDWQEDVHSLSLQAGRWYPSTMILANGSIMVIGGEVGSNSAAVPSIEILPYTGTAPVYMDWLDRTNPNNLYPFVSVLPSGNVFVAYWNEARILNPNNNFATIKTLPNMPGAVNDDLGGRTYPLEGAAVLLPQKAPYTDPLGILVCGGSTNGVSNALDNCVFGHPEAADNSWTLERMPSPRVMPCMAPLPDGTYLIANGAHHGVAGFGLATGPNLNALLYDPSKPAGRRITVAANTTIARLYHSEAITLLDGRVLISGSNPEDGVNPEEYRVEFYVPPYLLTGKPRPSFTIANKDWSYGAAGIPFSLGAAAQNGDITVTLLGSVSSTHGNSMGARTLMPAFSCAGTSCTVTAPPSANVAPPGWYQMFVLDGGVPAVGTYVRIGGDPAQLGNWPPGNFLKPGI